MFQKYKDLLTIGITAFNEEKYIRETVESCVNQAGTIIICDNASTDETGEICEELAKKYPNIRYNRLIKDAGKDFGFNFVLNSCHTKYFMWCGPHDILDLNYTSNMVHMLENSNAVGCFPAVRSITKEGEEIGIYDYWYSQDLLSDSAIDRVYSIIRNLHEVGCLYGIFKTEVVKKYPMPSGIGSDHPMICNIAKAGKIIFCPRSIFNFRQTKLELSREEIVESWKNSPMQSTQGLNHDFMIKEQLEILKSCKARSILEWLLKPVIIKKAHKKLKKRFGNEKN